MKATITLFVCFLALTSCNSNDTFLEPGNGNAAQRKLNKVQGPYKMGDETQTIVFTPTESGYIVGLECHGQSYMPVGQNMAAVETWATGLSSSTMSTAPYDSLLSDDTASTLVAYATVVTPQGSTFLFEDSYTSGANGSGIRLSRKVTPTKKASKEAAYNTYVMLRKSTAQKTTANEYYMPALVYKDGSNLTDLSIGANWNSKWILAREERMGLPIAMMRDTKTGVALSLTDYNLNPATENTDWGNDHLTSAAFKYASLGFCLEGDAPALTYCYPGSEGEHTYSNGVAVAGWSRRSTPISRNNKHVYTVELHATHNADFAEAQRDHWRTAFDLYSPEELAVDSKQILDVSLQTLDYYWLKSNGAPGFPFSVNCRTGKVHETSFDMGFVGMQASCGYYLYRYGLDNGNDTYRKKGEQIIDFWANNAANTDGMPRIWYDVDPWNSFRNYNDLRNMQGGMEAILLAWSCAEAERPGSHANWLKFCKRAADWMVSKQNSDGSFPKAFDNNGAVVDNGTYLTSNIIRFLTAMYGVTANKTYRSAVTKAADWCIQNITADHKYVGSVIDNPYVKDRESGQKMIEAMLAAYDLTAQKKYLDAAQKAAYYTVGYMYAWNIPWENNTTMAMPWPKKKSTVGITIIATGHSGADCGFSYNSFEYLRLYNITGDTYFLRIARLLEKNTKQTMNYDGTLGYPKRGLQREAIRCVTHRGDGVELWLPWCTAAALDPLFRMEDAYGKIGIDNILPKSQETRTAQATTNTAQATANTAQAATNPAPGSMQKPTQGTRPRLDESRYVRKLGLVRLPDGKTY